MEREKRNMTPSRMQTEVRGKRRHDEEEIRKGKEHNERAILTDGERKSERTTRDRSLHRATNCESVEVYV